MLSICTYIYSMGKEKSVKGRPSVYSEDLIQKTIDYVDSCEDTEKQVVTGQGSDFTRYETKLKVNIPTLEGLAFHLNIHRDTIHDWRGKYPAFSDVIEYLKQKQANRLLNMGLSGEYNSTIVKLMLNKHGYTDKQEIDHTSQGEKIQTFEIGGKRIDF